MDDFNAPTGVTVTNASSSLGHEPPFCKKYVARKPGLFHLWARIKRRNLMTEEEEFFIYYVDLYVAGGPLHIERFLPANVDAFDVHRVTVGPNPNKFQYPWYCTDFGYSPFDNRTHASYKPTNAQTQNIFDVKIEPIFVQPERIKVWYTVTAPGVILTDNLELVPGSPDRRKTKGLAGTTVIKVATDPVTTSNEFVITAAYGYSEAAAPLNEEPTEVVAVDETPQYRPTVEQINLNSIQYTTFTTHRPHHLEPYEDNKYTGDPENGIPNPWSPGPGKSGGVLFYQLIDQLDQGMPGVWVQERFLHPEQIPEGSHVNQNYNCWLTRKRGYPFQGGFFLRGTSSTKDGVWAEPDFLWLPNSWFEDNETNQFVLDGHQYFAGTNSTSLTGPGVHVGTYTLTITLGPGETAVQVKIN
jgi:hypothetical protein